MSKLVFLPKSDDDEVHRQLDLFIWAKAYDQMQDWYLIKWVDESKKLNCPNAEQFQNDADYFKAARLYLLEEKELERRFDIERLAISAAGQAAIRGTELPWGKTRDIVYERDSGRCQVCGDSVDWDNYECGHIIDRVAGGSDRLSNVVCMCRACNRLKPVTETREEYIAWAIQGGPSAFRKWVYNVSGRII